MLALIGCPFLLTNSFDHHISYILSVKYRQLFDNLLLGLWVTDNLLLLEDCSKNAHEKDVIVHLHYRCNNSSIIDVFGNF